MCDQDALGPEEVLKGLGHDGEGYPRELMQAAMDRQEEVTPHLLAYLQMLVREMDSLPTEARESLLPAFCFHLLGYFREPQAHQLIIDLATAPGDTADELFGEMLTEDLAALLWMTSAGDDKAIRQLIARHDADSFVRGQAMYALVNGVAEGVLQRDDVVQLLQSFLSGEIAETHDSVILTTAVVNLYHLHPGESMEVIREAYANYLIDTFMIDLELVESAAAEPREQVLSERLEERRQRLACNPHELLEGWAAFRPQRAVSPGPAPAEERRKKKLANREKSKSRRKIAKASKKKQRRK